MPEMNTDFPEEPQSWWQQLRASLATPLGMIGVGITTSFFILSVLGLIIQISNLVQNPYSAIFTFVLFPLGMLLGLLLIPLAVILKRRKLFAKTLTREGVLIDLGKPYHRKILLLVLVLTVVNIALFSSVAYEGYQYMDTPAFCGTLCHSVMAPEYTAHKQYPHANVACVECHIAPGIGGFLQAKFSGLHRLTDMISGSYTRPIPVPVENMPPATKTCERCHSPKRYFGDKKKVFIGFSNDDQKTPEKQEITLHLGGLDPMSGQYNGIHWHVNPKMRIYYQPLNPKLTKIGAIKVVMPNGKVKLFTTGPVNKKLPWKLMDCIDCHNRPAHIFKDPVKMVDFGLLSKKLDPNIPGIRQDGLAVLEHQYGNRDKASTEIPNELKKLQEKRNGKDFVLHNEKAITAAAAFLKSVYLENVWPKMKITWGTYKSEIGHQQTDAGYGCFRCHDGNHLTKSGDTVPQDCSLCHNMPF